MNETNKIQWSFPEYDERERNNDWFWALGVIVVASSITSIIFANYFFAILIVLSGGLIAMFSIKKPDMVSYEINAKGLQIRNRVFPYDKIKSFWVQTEGKPTLFIMSERLVMPIVSMPIEYIHADEIRKIMLEKNVKEVEMKEHFSEKIMEYVGF
ncbi:MAG: hypothetical protein WCI41_00525 [bacterium]